MKLKIKNSIIFALFISNINLPLLANASYFDNETYKTDNQVFYQRNISEYKTEIKGSLAIDAISDYTTASIGDNIYIIGGYDGNAELDTVRMFNTKTNEWTTKEPLNSSRRGATAVTVDNKIYVMGGFSYGLAENSFEIYDPTTDRWEIKYGLPSMIAFASSVAVGDKIYLIGGTRNYSTVWDSLYVYDTKNDSWEQKSNMVSNKYNVASVVLDNKIYIIGGNSYLLTDPARTSHRLNRFEVYDIENDSWTRLPNLPIDAAPRDAFVLENLICFKDNKDLYMYDIQQGHWSKKEGFFITENSYNCEIINGKVYSIGGSITIEVTYKEESRTEQESRAEELIEIAIASGSASDISIAREYINSLPDNEAKWRLQSMLDDVFPNMEFNKGNVSANLDVYIKSANMLSMSLDTSVVSFDDYSGVADIIKDDAIKITVNSSLPYKINAFMPSKIANANGTEEMPMDLFNIRESSKTTYEQFANNTDAVILKDNCNKGNNNIHYIDLKLASNQAHKADVYKTVLKFEIEQK